MPILSLVAFYTISTHTMKKLILALALFAFLIFACTNNTTTPPGGDSAHPPTSAGPGGFDTCSICTTCANPGMSDSLCSVIPHEVMFKISNDYVTNLDSSIQPHFDFFSWQSFIALNWPSDAKGNPIGTFTSNPNAPRVWETYCDPDTVFKTGVSSPGLSATLSALREARQKGLKFFRYSSKFHDPITPATQFLLADNNGLIDRNLNFVLFEEKLNPIEYNYIMKNNLNTKQGQLKFTSENPSAIQLPSGFYQGTTPYMNDSTVGAIEIKASWRILLPAKGDDTSRYYHRQALIFIPGANTASGKDLRVVATVGLVGLHIVHKTKAFGLQIWTTFEHIDNVPDDQQTAAMHAFDPHARRYSFYDPRCLTAPPNVPPGTPGKGNELKWNDTTPAEGYAYNYANHVVGDPGEQGQPQYYGTQVVRLIPVYFKTEEINKVWQQKVKGTVWENYKLIGSQWGKKQTNVPFTIINAPSLLANSTLETFEQTTSSCINCHNDFATISGTKIKTDMSFLFSHAK